MDWWVKNTEVNLNTIETVEKNQDFTALNNLESAIKIGLEDKDLKADEISSQASAYLEKKWYNKNDSDLFIKNIIDNIKTKNEYSKEKISLALIALSSDVDRIQRVTKQRVEKQSEKIEEFNWQIKLVPTNQSNAICMAENLSVFDVATAWFAALAAVSSVWALMNVISSWWKNWVPELVSMGALAYLWGKWVWENAKLDHIAGPDVLIKSLKNEGVSPVILNKFTADKTSTDNQLDYLSLFWKDAKISKIWELNSTVLADLNSINTNQKNLNMWFANSIDYDNYGLWMKKLKLGKNWEELSVSGKIENLWDVLTVCQKEWMGTTLIDNLTSNLANDQWVENKWLEDQLDTFQYMLKYMNKIWVNTNKKYESFHKIWNVINKESKIWKNLVKSIWW